MSSDTVAETKTVARLDWRTLMSATDDTPADIIAALDAYFEPFAQPNSIDKMECIECGKPMIGLTSFLLGGGFEWGLVHGEGRCTSCHWPARGHHFIKLPDGSDLAAIRNVPLQYHPDFVTKTEAS